MGQMTVVPRHWFSWNFRVMDSVGMPWAEIGLSSWRERGSVSVENRQYRVTREGLTGPFVLLGASGESARASKASVFKQEFTLAIGGRDYTLKKSSWWGREFALWDGATRVGSVVPAHWLSRRALVDLPEDLPAWARAFVVWLTLLMWKRDSDAGAVAAGS
jgi:hypothetical protein